MKERLYHGSVIPHITKLYANSKSSESENAVLYLTDSYPYSLFYNLANFQLQGTAHKVASFETHNLCLYELDKNGMTRFDDHWCFECYDDTTIDYVGTEKSITMDYKVAIL